MGRSGAGRGQQRSARARLAALVGAVVVIAYAAALVGVVLAGAPTARADNPPPFDIVLPKPSGGMAQGPVGANISITATPHSQDPYQLGYATQSAGCQSGFTAISGQGPLTADTTSGTLSATFLWPQGANDVGTQYVVCLQNANNTSTVLQSSETYQVDSASAPAISAKPMPTATPIAGTPTPSASTFYGGEQVRVQGKNFTPPGTTVLIYLTFSAQLHLSDLTAQNQLQPPDGSPIVSDSSGAFSATVTLPQNDTGTWHLQAVSNDSANQLLPSLQATKQISITLQPTPTPSPSPSPTVSPTPRTVVKPASKGSTTPGSGTVAAVVTLAGLSIVLFVSGILLLASTVTTPRRAP